MKFGNPFPGPYHDVAHHCIDLIYLFDAFHEDLANLDQDASRTGETATRATNAELCRLIQDKWIDFIVTDHSIRFEIEDQEKDKTTVYGIDRSPRVESLTEYDRYPEWMVQRKRFELFEKDQRAWRLVMGRIRGDVPVE